MSENFTVEETTIFPGMILKRVYKPIRSREQALQLSIEKWEILNDYCEKGILVHDGGRLTCALCTLYYFGHRDECEDCPILEVGHPGCYITPFNNYQHAIQEEDLEAAKKAAKEELHFLKELIR